ncbi:MAG: response regulator [Candidatus Nitrosopolaris sp.]
MNNYTHFNSRGTSMSGSTLVPSLHIDLSESELSSTTPRYGFKPGDMTANHMITYRLEEKQRFWKRILIVDDDKDITITFKAGIEDSNNNHNDANRRIEVLTYNNPVTALSEFKPNFYDLLLVDINMPHMNGFELSEKILATDLNVKVCFMSCAEKINYEALREISPALSLGCIIRKPVSIDYLVKRIRAELD